MRRRTAARQKPAAPENEWSRDHPNESATAGRMSVAGAQPPKANGLDKSLLARCIPLL